MKRTVLTFLAFILLLIPISSITFAQGKTDLTGTWKGPTWVDGAELELMLTLVLEHKKSGITGTLNDDMGYIDSEITEVKLEKNIFTFKAIASTPEGDVEMTIELTVTGDKMEGSWETEAGYSGTWAPEREEEK